MLERTPKNNMFLKENSYAYSPYADTNRLRTPMDFFYTF